MGRDKVLGLSLAILVIGFAGAFCFRNEEFVENGLKLARAKILDEGIAQRPGPKPYVVDSKPTATAPSKPTVTLEGIEAVDPEPPKTVQQSPRHRSAKISVDSEVPAKPDDSDGSPTDQFVSIKTQRSKPDPIPTEPAPTPPIPTTPGPSAAAPPSGPSKDSSTASIDSPIELTIRPATTAFSPPDSLLAEAANWPHSPDTRDGCPAMTGPEHSQGPEYDQATRSSPSNAPAGSTTYTVRRGDTLTKIAMHFFGDSNRYREIFDANRDQLQSLNARLKVGMTLQIPSDRPRAKRTVHTTASKTRTNRPGNTGGNTPPRTGQVTARPVARTREVPIHQSSQRPNDENRPTTPSGDNSSSESTGTLRFVPVQHGPFFRRGDSNSPDRPGRDLSQRPPAARGQNTSDRDSAGDAQGSASDRSRNTTTPKQPSDDSSKNSDGSEGM
jgi:nucleoid-associated protein YgaU